MGVTGIDFMAVQPASGGVGTVATPVLIWAITVADGSSLLSFTSSPVSSPAYHQMVYPYASQDKQAKRYNDHG